MLGRFRVHRDGVAIAVHASGKARALLAYLAVLRRNVARGAAGSIRSARDCSSYPAVCLAAAMSPPGPLRRNTRDAARPAPIRRARVHPPAIDAGILASGFAEARAEGPARQDQLHHEDARSCNESPTLAGSNADASPTSGSSSPDTPDGSFRSHARRARSPGGLRTATARPPGRGLGSNHRGALRRYGPDRGSGTCARPCRRSPLSTVAMSSPRSGAP